MTILKDPLAEVFSDVVNDPKQASDVVLRFLDDAKKQWRLGESGFTTTGRRDLCIRDVKPELWHINAGFFASNPQRFQEVRHHG